MRSVSALRDTLTVLLVDDHPLYRRGLRMLIEASDTELNVCEAGDIDEAVSMAAAQGVDVVLLELALCDVAHVETIRRFGAEAAPPVLIFSKYPYDDSLIAAMQAGACGYISDTRDVDAFLSCIRAAAAGEYILDSELAKKVVLRLRDLSRSDAERKPGREHGDLTGREREVLGFVAEGRTNHQIAMTLELSESTVKNHLSRVFEKLSVTSRSQAIVEAMRHGLV
jgi:two-component system, NarL family, nitrate/nitrite response regulator NarL